ncbi:PDT-domain-containing protein [Ascobolus immersus RN42]|uniref:prephenate dehydratase n=1 Tax=Ascobolus immersus RN42 TaxID=1160509 RepID=A0A3N4IQM0_ASCIM|nr:PDT-domain-containing protein [Ascobolus immersus RN42]
MGAQKKIPVAFLGPKSSYSYQAAINTFPTDSYDLIPHTTFGEIFHAVQTSTVAHALVPFENSTNGSIIPVLDLFCDRASTNNAIHVTQEVYLPVHHQFCSFAKTREEVKRIYSHPQAFGQCEIFLQGQYKGVERIDCSSTSRAVEIVAEEAKKGDFGGAAIGAEMAAGIHGVPVMSKDIEDDVSNTTRFLVISSPDVERSVRTGDDKTYLRFSIDHQKPGALCDALQAFKKQGLNLTSINSRPSRKEGRPWNYIFLVEFQGHEDGEGVRDCLADVEKVAWDVKVLGSFSNKRQ